MLEREVEILKAIQHEHIIQFRDYFEDDQYMYIVRLSRPASAAALYVLARDRCMLRDRR